MKRKRPGRVLSRFHEMKMVVIFFILTELKYILLGSAAVFIAWVMVTGFMIGMSYQIEKISQFAEQKREMFAEEHPLLVVDDRYQLTGLGR